MSYRDSVYHHGKRVSRAHELMLRAYEIEHKRFLYVNQGRRTIAEQTQFWNHYQQYGWPLAAYPSPNAPHIKNGQANHALDINAPEPVHSVAYFYRRHGIPVSFNVSSEAWHMDTLSEAKLIAAAKNVQRKYGLYTILKPGAHGPEVHKLKTAMYNKGLRGFLRSNNTYGVGAVRAIKRFQKSHHMTADGVVGRHTWAALLN